MARIKLLGPVEELRLLMMYIKVESGDARSWACLLGWAGHPPREYFGAEAVTVVASWSK